MKYRKKRGVTFNFNRPTLSNMVRRIIYPWNLPFSLCKFIVVLLIRDFFYDFSIRSSPVLFQSLDVFSEPLYNDLPLYSWCQVLVWGL